MRDNLYMYVHVYPSVHVHSRCYQRWSWSELRLLLLSLAEQEEWERSYRNCWRKEQKREIVGYGCACYFLGCGWIWLAPPLGVFVKAHMYMYMHM